MCLFSSFSPLLLDIISSSSIWCFCFFGVSKKRSKKGRREIRGEKWEKNTTKSKINVLCVESVVVVTVSQSTAFVDCAWTDKKQYLAEAKNRVVFCVVPQISLTRAPMWSCLVRSRGEKINISYIFEHASRCQSISIISLSLWFSIRKYDRLFCHITSWIHPLARFLPRVTLEFPWILQTSLVDSQHKFTHS